MSSLLKGVQKCSGLLGAGVRTSHPGQLEGVLGCREPKVFYLDLWALRRAEHLKTPKSVFLEFACEVCSVKGPRGTHSKRTLAHKPLAVSVQTDWFLLYILHLLSACIWCACGAIKDPDKKNVKEKGFILAHRSRLQSIIVGSQQKLGHMIP